MPTVRFARAARTADVAMFYYSGHAMQFNGVNYLMPVDARLEDEEDLRRLTRVDDIMNDLQQAKNLRILVLDFCRDNPFAESLKRLLVYPEHLHSPGDCRRWSADRHHRFVLHPGGPDGGRRQRPQQPVHSPPSSGVSRKPRKSARCFATSAPMLMKTSGRAQLPELSLSIIGKFYLNGPISIARQSRSCARRARHTFARQLKRTGRRRTRSAPPEPSKIMLRDFQSAHLPISPRRGLTS